MATRARIGLKLEDGSIISAYHHWDGYPEWLGVTLKEHYNTKEDIAKLIDGGNMSSCYSDNQYDEKTEPRATYYGGKEEAPILSKNFDEFIRIDCWQEYSYVFVKDRWVGYSIRHKFDENFDKMIDCIVNEVKIPEPEVA